jgi:hypothetical protein
MPRKTVISRKDSIDKIKSKIDIDTESSINITHELVTTSGGSIDNLPVKTEAFKNWLQEHRDHNPLIGKHVTSAPEETVIEEKVGEEEIIEGSEADAILRSTDDGIEEFNPNSEFGPSLEETGDSIRDGSDNHDKNFIDVTIAENITKKIAFESEEEIEATVISEIKKHHGDDEYEPIVDLTGIIERTKLITIENQTNNKKYLK